MNLQTNYHQNSNNAMRVARQIQDKNLHEIGMPNHETRLPFYWLFLRKHLSVSLKILDLNSKQTTRSTIYKKKNLELNLPCKVKTV